MIFSSGFLVCPLRVNCDFVLMIFSSGFLDCPLRVNWDLVLMIFSSGFLVCPLRVNWDLVLIIFSSGFLDIIANWDILWITLLIGFLNASFAFKSDCFLSVINSFPPKVNLFLILIILLYFLFAIILPFSFDSTLSSFSIQILGPLLSTS